MKYHHKRLSASAYPILIRQSNKCAVHVHPLYLVFPDLLRAVSETSYGIRVEFIGSDVVFAICFFVCLYLIRKVYSYPVKQTKHHILTTENSPSFPPQITPLFSLTTLSTASLVEASWNVMTHAQKPDFVFRRNGRVHLNRQGASVQSTTGSRGVRISGSNAGYTMCPRQCEGYWLPTPFTGFPFTPPPVRHSVPSRFNWTLRKF